MMLTNSAWDWALKIVYEEIERSTDRQMVWQKGAESCEHVDCCLMQAQFPLGAQSRSA